MNNITLIFNKATADIIYYGNSIRDDKVEIIKIEMTPGQASIFVKDNTEQIELLYKQSRNVIENQIAGNV